MAKNVWAKNIFQKLSTNLEIHEKKSKTKKYIILQASKKSKSTLFKQETKLLWQNVFDCYSGLSRSLFINFNSPVVRFIQLFAFSGQKWNGLECEK